MHRIEIIKVKGNKHPFLFVNQYQFYYNYNTNTNIHWQCKNYKKWKCKSRAITNSIETNAILIDGNFGHTCIPNLQSNIPMPTTPTSMPYYSDPTAATHGTPPLTTSVSVAATPSISSLINSEDPNMLKARVSDGNLNEVCVSREMLCNENSPILSDSTDAHEMSKDYCNGEIVDEEKQPYTYDKKPVTPTTTTSTTSGGFYDSNKNKISSITIRKNGGDICGIKQTIFNQHTTNFTVCFSDSSKPLNV
uniref:FLYWCH-type domain-containing protein n=1 Tax=Panagrolaimus davidi TaxID=227884 RepID=A0A914Q4A1_9BILA